MCSLNREGGECSDVDHSRVSDTISLPLDYTTYGWGSQGELLIMKETLKLMPE